MTAIPGSPPRTCAICGRTFGSSAYNDPEQHSCMEPVFEHWSSVAVEITRVNGARLKAEVAVTPSDSARTLASKLTKLLREMEAGHVDQGSGGPYR